MELVSYNQKTHDVVVKFREADFADLADFVAGACSAYGQMDEKVLGLSKERAIELCHALYTAMDHLIRARNVRNAG